MTLDERLGNVGDQLPSIGAEVGDQDADRRIAATVLVGREFHRERAVAVCRRWGKV